MTGIPRTLFTLAAGAAIGAAAVAALRPPAGRHPGLPPAASPAERVLDAAVPEVWLVDVPLPEAARRVGELAGVAVRVDESSFAAVGLPADKPVTVRGRNQVLAVVLDDLAAAAGGPDKPVRWHVDGDRVVLATLYGRSGEHDELTRVYDVRDLLAAVLPPPPPSGPPPTVCFPLAGRPNLPPPPPDPAENLSHLIMNTVAADTWRENAGSLGQIHPFAGRLVVTQTAANHREVGRLLAQLRTAVPEGTPPGPTEPESFRWHAQLDKWVSESTDAGEGRLRAVVPEFRADGLTLREALRRLAAVAGLDLVIDGDAERSPALDRPVRMGRRQAVAGDVLSALLRPSAAAEPPPEPIEVDPLGWWLDGAVVVVGRDADARRNALTRVYTVPAWIEAEERRLAATAGTRPHGGEITCREELVEELVAGIQRTVDPESWREAGGVLGAIRYSAGRLVVTQSWENHERVRRYINDQRVSRRRPSGEPATRPSAGPGSP